MTTDDKPRLRDALRRLSQACEAPGLAEKAVEWHQKLAEFEKAEAAKHATAAPK
ncbi:MAG: hypothetical protein ACLQVW_21045 [Limisphaerales bacterium]